MASIKISGLPEQTTAADDEYLVIGRKEAKKIGIGVFLEWLFNALGLKRIGEISVAYNSSTVTLSANETVAICELPVEAGTYLVCAKLGYSANEITDAMVAVGNTQYIYAAYRSESELTLVKTLNFSEACTLQLRAKGSGTIQSDARINYLQATRIA